MNRKKICIICVQCLLLSIASFLSGCTNQWEEFDSILFSWKKDVFEDKRENLFKTMDRQGLSVLYQAFPSEPDMDILQIFLEDAGNHGIGVYYLSGDPQWSLDESGQNQIRKIEAAAEINKCLTREAALKGIVFDIEPYLLDEWKDNKTEIMDSFVSGMKAAYTEAGKHGLKVILCIPYYYDSSGLEKQLETMISSCCDGVAVMNYYRGKEIEHISTEAEMAEKYGKELVNIYEMQPPGEHGLVEMNTYFNEGIEKMKENFRELRNKYRKQPVSMALHDYEALREAMEIE
ncbi:hypothetical protein [Murimonas intestini]|uniref:Uncharacterized protein n=1 Tax=Murimonas intestini TaxID=1337051 RepID=A0AB73T9W5_9FIRM|nr:hypothetical protein [Murimonas intestini]MCR1839178.1 hypothetical protein [Murimonas intestini]MCR1864474.1 hypothetical protein [Murimonas intestini]MCR1882084.1 hypothetical protein [Murimonas intestini]